jgi:hypothetical protein
MLCLDFPFVHTVDGKSHGEHVRGLHDRSFEEVISIESLLRRPTLLRVETHQLVDEIEGVVRHPFWKGQLSLERFTQLARKARLSWGWLEVLPETAFLRELRPISRRWMSARAKDEIQLRGLRVASEKASAAEHFGNAGLID